MSQKYEVFGKYILLDKIASGGMAEVYRAKAPGAEGIGKILAVKRILPQYSSNHDFIEMFKTEAKIAINLTQANIGQIFEFGVEKDQFFLLMEFIDGRNLRQVLSRCSKIQKALTIEQCVFIISQVANGLDYAHRCIDKNTGGPLNIIHRDMSPQNIMVSFEGEVKVIDFGIAKAESKLEVTRAGTLKGKFGYMSPEQAEGHDLDARTDIFSTGIVLWELLSGERLFVANNEVNTIRKIKECQIPSLRKINPHIHEELERISMKALAKDRNLRYQTSAELHRDLSRFLYRVNPEFTAHDLSVAVKTLFKEDILLDRKKSMEYAKVLFPTKKSKSSQPMEEKTVPSINTTTETNEHPFATAATQQAPQVPKVNEIIAPKGESKVEVFGQDQIDTFSSGPTNATMRTNTQFKHIATIPSSNPTGPTYVPDLARKLPAILIGLVVIFGGAYTYRNSDRLLESGKNMVNRIVQPSKVPTASREDQTPDPIKVHMMVHSIPAGAQVFVEGELSGSTPVEVKLDMNRKVTIAIKREGYLPYLKDVTPTTSPDEFTATLQKSLVGYISIDVQPTSADVYIDDQRLAEKLPISRYPVPAGKPLVIKAINPYLNMSATQSVLVRQDTVQSITLILSKDKVVRIPSGSK